MIVWSLIYLVIAVLETNMITNFTKTSLGVLKPHFLTVRNEIRAKKVFLRHISVILFTKKTFLTLPLNRSVDQTMLHEML